MENLVIRDIKIAEVPDLTLIFIEAEQELRRRKGQKPTPAKALDGVRSRGIARIRDEVQDISVSKQPGRGIRGAFKDSSMLGYVWFGPSPFARYKNLGYVEELYVHPDRWEHGIGRALFNNAAEALRAAGFTRMFLSTRQDNPVSNRFFLRLGGQVEASMTNVRHYFWDLNGLD